MQVGFIALTVKLSGISSDKYQSMNRKIPLNEAFDRTFHQKYSFSDFLNLDVKGEVNRFEVRGRAVYKPSDKLKKYHRFLNTFIFDYADMAEDVVHSYRKGKSPYTALAPHSASKFFLKTDIINFFYSFSLRHLESLIDKGVSESPISDIADYRNVLLRLISMDGKLPVGFGTSPSITNSLLWDFDLELREKGRELNVVYTRYSDDIILSSKSRENLIVVSEFIPEYLHKNLGVEFEMNPKKTKLTQIGNRVKILGMVVLPSGKITVDSDAKKELEVLLHFYIENKESYNSYLSSKFDGSAIKASGRLNYTNTIDPSFVDKLRAKYGSFVVDYFLSGMEV